VEIVRRLVLIIVVLAVPPVLTAALYYGTQYALAASHKMVDPQILYYATIAELVAFFLVMLLELRARW
jgi:hypothetical protein